MSKILIAAIAPVMLGFCASTAQAQGFDFKIEGSYYMPGEPMKITCSWPKQAPEKGGRIKFQPMLKSTAATKPSRPRTDISYLGAMRGPDPSKCVELRAPWIPGEYNIEAILETVPATPTRRHAVTVVQLPAEDILTFGGLKTEENSAATYAGFFYEYDLTFTDDRCYPEQSKWLGEHEQVFVVLVNRKTGRVAKTSDMNLLSGAKQCVKNCAEAPIENYCRRSGTYRRLMDVPDQAGEWDLFFVQQLKEGEPCIGDCIAVPGSHKRAASDVRILARADTLPPPDVERLYFTEDNLGKKPIKPEERLTSWSYLWVEFASANPFETETVSVSIDGGGDAAPIDVHRQSGNGGLLFRSEHLKPGDFVASKATDAQAARKSR